MKTHLKRKLLSAAFSFLQKRSGGKDAGVAFSLDLVDHYAVLFLIIIDIAAELLFFINAICHFSLLFFCSTPMGWCLLTSAVFGFFS